MKVSTTADDKTHFKHKDADSVAVKGLEKNIANREWPQSQETNLCDHTGHSLVSLSEAAGMPCRTTRDGRVTAEVLTKAGSLEKGMAKHVPSCLEAP